MDKTPTVTVMQANPTDPFQIAIAKIVEGEKEWSPSIDKTWTTIDSQREQQAKELFADAKQVDLVGHSTPIQHYLKLGDWVLDPLAAARLASYMPSSVESVRLIGCETATQQGASAIEVFARSGRSAYGTINNVYITHFDKRGVKRGIEEPGLKEYLPVTGQPRPVVAPPVSHPVVQKTLTTIKHYASALSALPATLRWLCLRLSANRKIPHRWVRWLLGPQGTAMPGLLTEPLLTLQIPSGQRTWTLEILFDFKYARYYSSTDSEAEWQRVYKIRPGSKQAMKTLLEAYLETAPNGVEVRTRHEEAGNRCDQLACEPSGCPKPANRGARPWAALVMIKRVAPPAKEARFDEHEQTSRN